MLDTILMTMLEQLARARNPRARARTLALVHQAEREPERASRGAVNGAQIQADVVRTRPELGAVPVPANQVRSGCQSLEIVRLERLIAVGCRQEDASVRPRAA